jgi:hypothetical protein
MRKPQQRLPLSINVWRTDGATMQRSTMKIPVLRAAIMASLLMPLSVFAEPRQLTAKEIDCRIWSVSTTSGSGLSANTRFYYIDAPTMTVISQNGGDVPAEDRMAALAAFIQVLQSTKTEANKYPKDCLISGVESTVAAEQIRVFAESGLKKDVMDSVRTHMDNFLSEIKKANDADREKIINRLVQELKTNADLVASLKKALAK